MYLLVNITSECCFPIYEIDNINTLKAASSYINEDSKNIHSTEMINQSDIRMTSFDGCSEVSRFMNISITVYDDIICMLMS